MKNDNISKDLIIESVIISNPDKILFEKDKITKKNIVLYYQQVASRMLPYLKNRIISTVRCPNGVDESCFFKKHLDSKNNGVSIINLPNDSGNKEDYYYINSISGLISEVQMNTIEFHTWGSSVNSLNNPDIMIFDLDPDELLDLKNVRQGVKDLKSILDELSLVSFLKTSGGKGYHIIVPFLPVDNWDIFRNFAKNIAEIMEKKWPDKYVSNMRKEKRKNKIFIDWVRNTKGATSISPYSLRIKKNATISMPIKWNELDKITPNEITINEALQRLKLKDPWEKFFQINQTLK